MENKDDIKAIVWVFDALIAQIVLPVYLEILTWQPFSTLVQGYSSRSVILRASGEYIPGSILTLHMGQVSLKTE